MAFYTKRQFADLVGIPTKDLSNYIKRRKVILKGDKPCKCQDKRNCSCLIDDTVEENRLFIEKRGVSQPEITEPDPIIPKKEQPVVEKSRTIVPKTAPQQGKGRLTQLTESRIEKQNSKIDEEIALLQAKREKINEEIIPKEHVVHLIVAQAEGVKGAWMRATDTFITQFAAANAMSREDIVYWRKQLTTVVNEAVDEGITNSKKNLKRMAREHAGKKGKGERDDT